ncbi:ubiquitin-like domain-containing protein [Pelotomaculum propionicicum]|uniref:ubiquitin-like domain-containing protein n=1 Tax=Pelotomaculum propionicicum TaxID=258475 RepID=UPI003B804C45
MSWRSLRDCLISAGLTKLRDRKSGFFSRWAAVSIAAVIILVVICACFQSSVVIIADGKEVAVRTFSRSVGAVLESKGFVLLENDIVEPSLDTQLVSGMVVTVNRAADVSIIVDGQVLPVRTQCRTVDDLLREAAVVLGPEDELSPARDAAITQGMNVIVSRIITKTESMEAVMSFETNTKHTVNLPQGVTRIAEEGRDGTEQQTWNIKYKDGIEVARQLVSRETITLPVNKLIMVGSGLVVSRGGEDIRYSEAVDMLSSAYSHTGYNTSSGVAPYYGVAAVDPDYIPLGTELYVEGYGYATALDVGSSITGNRIDLFFDSHDEAMSWGIRNVKVYIID